MKKTLLASVASLLLSIGAAHACELEVKIIKENYLHVLEKCVGVETFHQDMKFYHPRGEVHDAAHECLLDSVERIDQAGVIVHTYCGLRKGNKKSALIIQSTGESHIDNEYRELLREREQENVASCDTPHRRCAVFLVRLLLHSHSVAQSDRPPVLRQFHPG
jgi:hypothetical protein